MKCTMPLQSPAFQRERHEKDILRYGKKSLTDFRQPIPHQFGVSNTAVNLAVGEGEELRHGVWMEMVGPVFVDTPHPGKGKKQRIISEWKSRIFKEKTM